VTTTRASAAEALADVRSRSLLLGDVLDSFDIERPQRLTESVSVSPREEYDDRGQATQAGFVALNRLLISSADLARAGELIAEAVERAGSRVEGPWWRVAASNDAWERARREAVLDARRRAEAYAAALDLQLGAVVEVAEPTVRTGAAIGYSTTFAPLGGLEVESGDFGVSAAVDVTFALESR
jgi:uncharacterized protein YggE